MLDGRRQDRPTAARDLGSLCRVCNLWLSLKMEAAKGVHCSELVTHGGWRSRLLCVREGGGWLVGRPGDFDVSTRRGKIHIQGRPEACQSGTTVNSNAQRECSRRMRVGGGAYGKECQ